MWIGYLNIYNDIFYIKKEIIFKIFSCNNLVNKLCLELKCIQEVE